MKTLLAAILTLSQLPFASFAGHSTDKTGSHTESKAPTSKTSHENSNDDDDYPPEGNDGER